MQNDDPAGLRGGAWSVLGQNSPCTQCHAEGFLGGSGDWTAHASSARIRRVVHPRQLSARRDVSGGVKPRINGEQRASEATRCRAGHQEVASRQAASRLLRCAPALRVTCHNLLIRLAFMAGSQLPAVTGPFARTRRSRMSTPTSCVRQISALLRSHQHAIALGLADSVLAAVPARDIRPNDVLRFARSCGLKKHAARRIVVHVISAVRRWRALGADAGRRFGGHRSDRTNTPYRTGVAQLPQYSMIGCVTARPLGNEASSSRLSRRRGATIAIGA